MYSFLQRKTFVIPEEPLFPSFSTRSQRTLNSHREPYEAGEALTDEMWLRCAAAFPVGAAQLRCAALLLPGGARRNPSDGQTAVVGGATGPLPKPGEASVAIAEE